MRFRKIRYAEKTGVALEYEERDGETTHQHVLASDEVPTPEFIASLTGLQRHLGTVTDLPADYLNTAVVTAAHLSYDKNDRRTLTVSAHRPVTNSNSPFNINTPPLIETEEIRDGSLFGDIGKLTEFFNDVDALAKHAERFIEGERGEKTPDAPAADSSDPGQTTIEEHISDAGRSQARKAFLTIMGDKPAGQPMSARALTDIIVSRFDRVVFLDNDGDPDARKIPGLYRHELTDDDGQAVRYVWCRVGMLGDGESGEVPCFWYDAPVDAFDPAAHAPTLKGFHLVEILRDVWTLQKKAAPELVGAGV